MGLARSTWAKIGGTAAALVGLNYAWPLIVSTYQQLVGEATAEG